MIITTAIKRIFLMYHASYLHVHFLIIGISFGVFYLVQNSIDPKTIYENYMVLLNGMGVMATFFIMTIEKVNMSKLIERYKKTSNLFCTRKSISQGNRYFNLIYSITFSGFALLLFLYLQVFFDIRNLFLLILLIVNLFVGFMIVLVVWHLIESKV